MSIDNQSITQTEHHFAHHFKNAEHEYVTSKQGIWLFMVTEILMFGAIFVAYGIFHSLYPEMFAEGASHLDWKMGFINTLVLITSSYTMAMSIHHVQKNQINQAITKLIITLVCACIFLLIKYFEYQHKFELGLYPGKWFEYKDAQHANLALYFSFYFVMTGLHGIHVLFGMGLITWVLIRTKRGDFSDKHYTALEGVGIFWHIVDLIWIYLFPILYLIG
jgi:cytochrome c oxidase subunit 3